jgi:predicted amino acid dehydrogenase
LTKFAFVLHPLTARDAAKKYLWAKYLPESIVEKVLLKKEPSFVSNITGIRSKTGATTEGIFVACPMTTRQLSDKNLDELALERLVQCAEIAKEHGAEIMGLGAFTAITGDAGITLAKCSPIGITTGNSYTVATAIEGTLRACELLDLHPADATLAVVGATGSIGKTCAQVLSKRFGKTLVIGRDSERTSQLAATLPNAEATIDLARIREADAVIAVTSSDSAVILPEHLKPGAVVCDVSRPRDVSVRVAKERQDVLVIEGGVVSVPGDVNFGIDFGFPAQTAYACMSETMLLALENRPEHYTLGKDVSEEQVEEMLALAKKHGFMLAGFRSFEKAVGQEAIDRAKEARRKGSSSSMPKGRALVQP